MRFLLRHSRTGAWLHRDLPLSDPEVTWGLGTASELNATVTPQVKTAIGDDGQPLLVPWRTEVIVVEGSNRLTWRGPVVGGGATGPTLSVRCSGVAGYLGGLPYLGNYKRVGLDPADALRELWRHASSFPGGDYGLEVDDTATPERIGTDDEPYHLAWWDAPDMGQEADMLARETPFDVREEHTWGPGGQPASRLRIGYPRLGRHRADLRFAEGENIVEAVTVSRDGDEYATEVLWLGRGEGRAKVRGSAVSTDKDTMRRVAVVNDDTTASTRRADALAARALAHFSQLDDIAEITVAGQVPVQPGDDILVQARSGWLGPVRRWCRVLAITRGLGANTRLTLSRAEAWRYD